MKIWPRVRSEPRPIFFIHIMRTAGTSFRSMLEGIFDEPEIYPGQERIKRLGRYPELDEVLRDKEMVTRARLVVGHYPYVLRSIWPDPPVTCTILRDPVQRTISILKFARLRRRQFSKDTPLTEVFEDRRFNQAMIRDYQTKVFALPDLSVSKGVNYPAPMPLSIEAAKERVGSCDLVGLTERFEETIDAFEASTRIRLPESVHVNRSTSTEEVDDALRARIEEVTSMDRELVDFANEMMNSRSSRARARE